MTPPIPARPNVNHPYAPPLPPPPKGGQASVETVEIKSDSPLIKLLQSSGRTPTHPLTAKPTAEEKKVTPVDVQKAEQAYRQAEIHAKRGRLNEAFKALEKAYLLNPNDEKIAGSLGEILAVGGQPFLAHALVSEFLDRHPDSDALRSGRVSLSQALIAPLQMKAAQADPEDKKEMLEKAQELLLLGATDQAILYKNGASKIRETLQAFDKESPDIHKRDLNGKAAVLGDLQNQGQMLFELSRLPTLTGPEGEAIAKELKALATEITDAVIRFAENDSDPQVIAQVLPLKANRALTLGETDNAIQLYSDYRDAECKKLGEGDAEKGLSILKEKFEKAKSLAEENKIEEAKQAIEGVPEGLLMAHDLLEKVEGEKILKANLSAIDAWRENVITRSESQREEAGEGGWDLFWGNTTDREKITTEEFRETNLISEVRGRLTTGKSRTIAEALNYIRENGNAEDKQKAMEVLSVSGFFAFGPLGTTGRLVHYTYSKKPSTEEGAELLKEADELAKGGELQKRAATGIYRMVSLLSTDATQRAEAQKGLQP